MQKIAIYPWFGINKPAFIFAVLASLFPHTVYTQNSHSYCSVTGADVDGDGYGWEDNKSCVVRGSAADRSRPLNTSVHPACVSSESDPDGDGYGFENGKSCVVPGRSGNSGSGNISLPVCKNNSDPDGDGYGWEDGLSCVVSAAKREKTKTSEIGVSDITDVVLVTGQSNLLATHTSFDSNLDQPHPRVFAYTDKGWQVADLHQVWDINAHPGNHSLVNPANQPYNNFAMHFGKVMATEDSDRVVAFIVASAPGRGIAHWDKGAGFYRFISDKVSSALQALPHKYSVDGILWQQGENDWLYEGTSDAGATGFSSRDSDEYRNYYKIKLENLIANFRGEPWGRADSAFICGETRRATGVNRRLMALNSDSDPLTGCVPATDLPKRHDDPYGSHFSAEGLRALGRRYAREFRRMTDG